MQLVEVRNDCLRKIWVENPDLAPSYVLEDVRNAINQAVQFIWLAGPEHFRRADFTFATTAGTAGYDLDPSVQEVIGPVRLDGVGHLRPVKDRGTFDHYHTRLRGGEDDDPPNGTPEVYHIEQRNQSGADNLKIAVLLTPTPDASYTIRYEASISAPSFTLTDLAGAAPLPVPHEYVESLFLPIARYYSMRSHFFGQEEHRAALVEDFEAALRLYGLSDAVGGDWKRLAISD